MPRNKRTFAKVAAITAVMAVAMAAPANADPDPYTPQPIVPTPGGPWLPGAQTYAPVCAVYPQSCALRYDPSTGTWQPKG
jgi:hypothetical protein